VSALVTLSIPSPTLAPVDEHVTRAESFPVTTAEQYADGAAYLSLLKGLWDGLEAQRVDLKEPALEAGRRVDKLFKPLLNTVAAARQTMTHKLNVYDEQQRRLAAQRQREAERAAELARQKAAQDAEIARQTAAREAAEARELAAKQEVAREKAAREAAEAQASGDRQRALEAMKEARRAERRAEVLEQQAIAVTVDAELAANKLEEQAELVVVEKVTADLPQVDGQQRVRRWQWELTDLSKVDRKYLKLDEQAVTKIVNAMKDKAEEFIGGGIRVFPKDDFRRG
jgi:dTMP kinase